MLLDEVQDHFLWLQCSFTEFLEKKKILLTSFKHTDINFKMKN